MIFKKNRAQQIRGRIEEHSQIDTSKMRSNYLQDFSKPKESQLLVGRPKFWEDLYRNQKGDWKRKNEELL